MTTNKSWISNHNIDALQDGTKYAEWPEGASEPEDYFPVAYRVRITGIVVNNSGWQDDMQGDPEEIVREMYSNGSLGIELVRQTDAHPLPPEIQEERKRQQRERADKIWEQYRRSRIEEQPEASGASFEAVSDLVSGVYKAQGILSTETVGGEE